MEVDRADCYPLHRLTVLLLVFFFSDQSEFRNSTLKEINLLI
jgi:hypothetical protein